MKPFKRNEDAMAPVIGVILMIVITVALAGVVAVVAFDMADTIHIHRTVGVASQVEDGVITITLVSGSDLKALTNVSVSLDGNVYPTDDNLRLNSITVEDSDLSKKYFDGRWIHHEGSAPFGAGDVITIVGQTKGRLVVTGRFSDGTEQVLLQKTFR